MTRKVTVQEILEVQGGAPSRLAFPAKVVAPLTLTTFRRTLLHIGLEPQQLHVQVPHIAQGLGGHEGPRHQRTCGHVGN